MQIVVNNALEYLEKVDSGFYVVQELVECSLYGNRVWDVRLYLALLFFNDEIQIFLYP